MDQLRALFNKLIVIKNPKKEDLSDLLDELYFPKGQTYYDFTWLYQKVLSLQEPKRTELIELFNSMSAYADSYPEEEIITLKCTTCHSELKMSDFYYSELIQTMIRYKISGPPYTPCEKCKVGKMYCLENYTKHKK